MTVSVHLAARSDLDEIYALRYVVFVVGQNVPADIELDELDATATHAVARLDGDVVGTGRLLAPPAPGEPAVIGRMAVSAETRGTGVGAALLALLEETARAQGWPTVELHAQVHARGFYDRAGYTAFGDPYLEAGIEHVSMRKSL
ncbi:MAG TPA: GNAT family N-acetyltransferase [Mycobacteriales bacterium]|nr:GNAT family N-acetyltransferase [Mycobacteriales bacterium]